MTCKPPARVQRKIKSRVCWISRSVRAAKCKKRISHGGKWRSKS